MLSLSLSVYVYIYTYARPYILHSMNVPEGGKQLG